jgi:hypothetical protein
MRDGLTNLSESVKPAQPAYERGIVLGIVTVLMAQGKSFEQTVEFLKPYLPKDLRISSIPVSWQEEFEKCLKS